LQLTVRGASREVRHALDVAGVEQDLAIESAATEP